MSDKVSAENLQQLGALIRAALVAADGLALPRIAIDLDSALNQVVALDETGTIEPQPFSLKDLDLICEGRSSAA